MPFFAKPLSRLRCYVTSAVHRLTVYIYTLRSVAVDFFSLLCAPHGINLPLVNFEMFILHYV